MRCVRRPMPVTKGQHLSHQAERSPLAPQSTCPPGFTTLNARGSPPTTKDQYLCPLSDCGQAERITFASQSTCPPGCTALDARGTPCQRPSDGILASVASPPPWGPPPPAIARPLPKLLGGVAPTAAAVEAATRELGALRKAPPPPPIFVWAPEACSTSLASRVAPPGPAM